jgi:hypothetical protein
MTDFGFHSGFNTNMNFGFQQSFNSVLSPNEIFGADLYDWWDFTDTSTQSITGGLIDSITSKDTNGAVFASSGTERPASIVGVNGLNVADFDGVNDFMQVAGSTGMYNFLHNGSLGTVILISRIEDANPDNNQVFLSNNGVLSSNIGYSLQYDDRSSIPTNNGIRAVVTKGVTGRFVIISLEDNYYTPQQYNLLIQTLDTDNVIVADRQELFLNNGLGQNTVGAFAYELPVTSNAFNDFTIGKNSNTLSNYLKGQIPEVIILKDIHPTPTQITQLNNYLTNKYGGTFPII